MTDPQPPSPAAGPDKTPRPLVAAAALVAAEGVLLLVYGVTLVGSVASSRLAMGVTTPIFFALYGAGLGFLAWKLFRLQSWARAPIVLAQLIQLGVAWSFVGGSGTAVTVVLAVAAVLVLVGVFHPASLRALTDEDR